ncbi:lactosylceramide 4-alpha-galactosyltransferase-like [Rhipicephalus sanguineus]|uniref:lactosylceramide 4-alpha-galactosyltransferase-like n=1 Tax=Rhipicephalus sanguineus TaxID=34632 RepID=UPI0018939891|nr:lactosylceramide 4-alpha-galactosyltransferase-like [Rhipicephalus sanguineus]
MATFKVTHFNTLIRRQTCKLIERLKLTLKQACSIESACRYNSDYLVHLLSTGNISSSDCKFLRLLSSLPNFRSAGLDARAELLDTPLAPLQAKGGALHRSPHAAAHLSDFLRYVLLWRRGGVYLDSDVIVMKSLKGITNSVVYQGGNDSFVLANGILFFDKRHAVLEELINKCASSYNPEWRITCGPGLMSMLPSDKKFSRQLKFINESAFFVVPWQEWEHLFNPEMAPVVLSAINTSYGVHFWNSLSETRRVVPGSGSAMDVLARTHCPRVYLEALYEGDF